MTLRVNLLLAALLVPALGCEPDAGPVGVAPSAPTSPPTREAAPVASSAVPAPPSALPSPRAPRTTRFAGTFVGDRLALTLVARSEHRREGTLRIRAASYPLHGTESSKGLEGSFTAGGKERTFFARQKDDDTVVLTADGRSFVLTRPTAIEPWAGRFAGDGQGSVLLLTRTGAALSGRIDLGGQRHALVGTLADDAARGTISDPQTGVDHPFRATRSAGTLTFVIHTVTGERTSLRTLIFKR